MALVLAFGGIAPSTAAPDRSTAGALSTPSWPQYRADAAGTGYQRNETQLSPSTVANLKVKWEAQTFQTVFSAPAEANGVLYFGARIGCSCTTLTAVKASTGVTIWSSPVAGHVNGSPDVHHGVIYVTADDGNLYAFSVKTGAVLWKAATGSSSSNTPLPSPVAVNGVVYVGSTGTRTFYAFDAAGCGNPTCQPIWTGTLLDGTSATPAVSGGNVFITDDDENLYAFPAAGCGQSTCQPTWTASAGTFHNISMASPSVHKGMVYVGAVFGISAFKALGCGKPTCKAKWTVLPSGQFNSTAVAGGAVYASGFNEVVSVDARTGATNWTKTLNDGNGSPGISTTVANGVVYTQNSNTAHALDASNGEVLWSYFVGFGKQAPVIANGWLYVASVDGESLLGFHL